MSSVCRLLTETEGGLKAKRRHIGGDPIVPEFSGSICELFR